MSKKLNDEEARTKAYIAKMERVRVESAMNSSRVALYTALIHDAELRGAPKGWTE